ncbi:hypothetical protein, partial [Mesorhizobium sp. M7A.F.Ca.US.014.04.1.1]|uniref:hypothetical protein n=1 Tax=Mesorhizobium sp. M7A.F.Ca.US.014.04.1.1 TaxID=2496744 RepID=UPI0013E09FF4
QRTGLVTPGLPHRRADRDPKLEFNILSHEPLPRPEALGVRRNRAWQLHPPSKDAAPVGQNQLVADRVADPKADPGLGAHPFTQPD